MDIYPPDEVPRVHSRVLLITKISARDRRILKNPPLIRLFQVKPRPLVAVVENQRIYTCFSATDQPSVGARRGFTNNFFISPFPRRMQAVPDWHAHSAAVCHIDAIIAILTFVT
jgi:hypothetical protein